MESCSASLEIDDCNDCPSGGSISEVDVPTPWAAYRRPSSRSNTFLHAFPPYSGRSSVYGSISSSINVPTPCAAYPTATGSPRSSRAYSGSFFPQIGRTFSSQLWGAFPSANTITTVLESPSHHSSATNSNAVSRHSDTPPSGQVSPTSESDDPLKYRASSSASSPIGSAHRNVSPFSRRATLPVLPNVPSSTFSSLLPTYPTPTESQKPSLQPPIEDPAARSTSIHPTDLGTLEDIFEKIYPRSKNMPWITSLGGQREMVQTMYLDNIRHATARLHKHQWIMGATNEHYKTLCGTDRVDLVHEDLSRYTQAIKDYDFWLTSSTSKQKLDLPPNFHEQGRTLAMFELASHPAVQSLFTSQEKRLLAKMEETFVARNHAWSQANTINRIESTKRESTDRRKKGILLRFLMGSFGASSVIVLLLLLSMEPKLVVTFMVTSILILIGAFLVVNFLVDAAKKVSIPQLLRGLKFFRRECVKNQAA